MNLDQERYTIIQPNSWETIVAQQAALSPDQLVSTPPATALHAAARSFLAACCKNPTRFQTDELSRCISSYNTRQKEWQNRLEELREEDEDLLDELDKQEAVSAAQSNISLGTLLTYQQQISHYTDLLFTAQKYADATQFLRTERLPANLPPAKARQAFITLLCKHAVIYTPLAIVDTIKKLIAYYRLQYQWYIAKTFRNNTVINGYEQGVEEELQNIERFKQISTLSVKQSQQALAALTSLPSPEVLASMQNEIDISPEEQNQLDAWEALQEEFPVPESLFEEESSAGCEQIQEELQLDLQQPTLVDYTGKTAEEIPAPPNVPAALPKKLPKMYNKSPLNKVCLFMYGLTKDEAFAQVPTTSQGVKKMLDKFYTPPLMDIHHSLETEIRIQYNMARKRLGDFFQQLLEEESARQTKQTLDAISACREDLPVDDPGADYREEPLNAVDFLYT